MRSALASLLLLTGCGTLGLGGAQPAATQLAANGAAVEGAKLLPDGLVDELGVDVTVAITRAQADALMAETAGAPILWSFGDISGRVVPGPKYMVNTRVCRDLVHVAERDRNRISGRATLCLSRVGSWERVG